MTSPGSRLHPFCRWLGIAALLALNSAAQAAEPGRVSSVAVVAGSIVLVLAGFTGWILLVWWIRKLILDRLTAVAFEKTRAITSRSLRRVSFRQLLQLSELGVRVASLGLILLGTFVAVVLVLAAIPSTRSWADQLENLILTELMVLGEGTLSALPGLMVIAVVFFLTRIVHEILKHFFRSVSAGEIQSSVFDPVTAETTRRLAGVGLWVCAAIIAFPYLPGNESAAFRGVSVLAGLMFSIGSASLVTQFASGLALIYGRVVRPGDYVEIGQTEGVIEHIGLLACSIRTPRDEVVALPNVTVAGGVKNYSRGQTGVRFAATVSIGYDTPWRKVRELLLAAAAATPGIRAEPAPTVRQAALDDFYVSYELLVTPEEPQHRTALLGRLHESIQDRFAEAGVQIMSPHYEGDPAGPKLPPRPEATK